MQINYFTKFLFVGLLFLSGTLFAQEVEHHIDEPNAEHNDALEEEISEDIDHHIQDSHSFTFFSDKEAGKHYGFPLPVILWDDGLQVFSSSKFHHGETVAENNGNYYKLYHSKIYKTDASGTLNFDEDHHAINKKPLDFSITKNVVMMFVTGLLMFLLFAGLARSFGKGPIARGAGRFFEPIVLYIRDDIAKPNIGPKYKKFMPYLLTVFFFIWFLNLFGLTPLGVNVTGNISVTLALALLTFIITQFSGNKNYWKHIFWMPGVPVPMKFILAPIELLGVFIKPFALMIRLYANIMAGHVVLMSIIALVFFVQNWIGGGLSLFLAFFLSIIELLVAALQAYIFTLLSALYFGFAVEEHDEAH
ncbi:F0F1 ATP synthase subunit A [Aggregatimonas sangjinii]|uniref:ATP synthase subunit a n=1 Tax=Aggregatimonas sangjinii TaxID=2583587 RepID=A0A5B7SXL7_9FLAO|nr:F0F1 ATP synthase subunit A [Aggregatimonas sangjinii]QCX01828.1 F0F1 ATP synthase subunit A [Aggregatimonas sangjinii]